MSKQLAREGRKNGPEKDYKISIARETIKVTGWMVEMLKVLEDRIHIQPYSNMSLMEGVRELERQEHTLLWRKGFGGKSKTTQVDMIKAWNKFSAVRFCSGVP